MTVEFVKVADLSPFCPGDSCRDVSTLDEIHSPEEIRADTLAYLAGRLQRLVFGAVIEEDIGLLTTDTASGKFPLKRDFIEITPQEVANAARKSTDAKLPITIPAFWELAGKDGDERLISISDLTLAFIEERSELMFLRDHIQVTANDISLSGPLIAAAAALIPAEEIQGEASQEGTGIALFRMIIEGEIDLSSLSKNLGGQVPDKT